MSGLSGSQNETIGSDNIEKVAGTTGLVGYASTYISLQAVNGIFINGIGSGNKPSDKLPFSDTAQNDSTLISSTDDQKPSTLISSTDEGDFYISGQNGNAVIKSGNRTGETGSGSGSGIGSIHIDSTSGDVVVNVPNGSFTVNSKSDYIELADGNRTSRIKGHVTSHVEGAFTEFLNGLHKSITKGKELNINIEAKEDIIIGNELKINVGAVEDIIIGNELKINVGAVEDIKLGIVKDSHPFHTSDLDAEMKKVNAKFVDHLAMIENGKMHLQTVEANLHTATIHILN